MVEYDDVNLIGLNEIKTMLKSKEKLMYEEVGKGAAESPPQTPTQ